MKAIKAIKVHHFLIPNCIDRCLSKPEPLRHRDSVRRVADRAESGKAGLVRVLGEALSNLLRPFRLRKPRSRLKDYSGSLIFLAKWYIRGGRARVAAFRGRVRLGD